MSTATSASDRYEAARDALDNYDGCPREMRDEFAPHDLADALRGLITPPATDETPQQIAARVRDRQDSPSWEPDRAGRYTVQQVTLMMRAAVEAGIQAAWESWEPENAPGVDSGSLEQLATEASEVIGRFEDRSSKLGASIETPFERELFKALRAIVAEVRA
ncbi:hypothetical protein MRBLMI12_000466 [Microbacterium sp. LMI12-1-1.1]|uniref:hypothetical protein n=1 Tax=Microbacterium sp. LMI12-1-1.1 TaxID=3135225 RepID=UPI00344A58F2